MQYCIGVLYALYIERTHNWVLLNVQHNLFFLGTNIDDMEQISVQKGNICLMNAIIFRSTKIKIKNDIIKLMN